jgi:hypothetical protein
VPKIKQITIILDFVKGTRMVEPPVSEMGLQTAKKTRQLAF